MSAVPLRGVGEHGVGERRQRSAMHELLEEPIRISQSAARDLSQRDGARRAHLRQQVVRPHDGAGHELREEGDEQREVEQVCARLEVAPVDVDRVEIDWNV